MLIDANILISPISDAASFFYVDDLIDGLVRLMATPGEVTTESLNARRMLVGRSGTWQDSGQR
jgi:hypothetical protein